MRGSALLAIVIAATTPLLILTVVAVATGFRLVAWQPPVLWQHSLGVGGVTAIASDSSGVYVEGYNHWQLVGPGSVFLKKYDSSGGVVWNRTIGEFNNAMINEMSVGTDSIYLSAGNFSNGIFLKYDLAGNNLWERDYAAGTNPIWGSSFGLSALPEGVYVTGDSSLWTSPTYASSVAWVREYDSAGNAAWTSEFSSDTIISTHVYASSLGVFIAYSAGNTTRYLGSFLAKYSLSGNQLWTRQVPAAGGISGDS